MGFSFNKVIGFGFFSFYFGVFFKNFNIQGFSQVREDLLVWVLNVCCCYREVVFYIFFIYVKVLRMIRGFFGVRVFRLFCFSFAIAQFCIQEGSRASRGSGRVCQFYRQGQVVVGSRYVGIKRLFCYFVFLLFRYLVRFVFGVQLVKRVEKKIF